MPVTPQCLLPCIRARSISCCHA